MVDAPDDPYRGDEVWRDVCERTGLPPFHVETVGEHFNAVVCGSTNTGKSTLVADQLRHIRHRFSRMIVVSSTDRSNGNWSRITPPSFVWDSITPSQLERIVADQMRLVESPDWLGARLVQKRLAMVYEDVATDTKLLKAKPFLDLYTQGRHGGITAWLLTQRAKAAGVTVRANTLVYYQAWSETESERKAAYADYFNGSFENMKAFTETLLLCRATHCYLVATKMSDDAGGATSVRVVRANARYGFTEYPRPPRKLKPKHFSLPVQWGTDRQWAMSNEAHTRGFPAQLIEHCRDVVRAVGRGEIEFGDIMPVDPRHPLADVYLGRATLYDVIVKYTLSLKRRSDKPGETPARPTPPSRSQRMRAARRVAGDGPVPIPVGEQYARALESLVPGIGTVLPSPRQEMRQIAARERESRRELMGYRQTHE